MIRAAAKNHSHVAVVVDPNDYDELLQHLSGSSNAQEALQYRKRLAWKAFQHCATYDSTVAEWLWSQIGKPCLIILCTKGMKFAHLGLLVVLESCAICTAHAVHTQHSQQAARPVQPHINLNQARPNAAQLQTVNNKTPYKDLLLLVIQ